MRRRPRGCGKRSLPRPRASIVHDRLAFYIGGKWSQASDGATRDVINPATEEVIGRLPMATPADLDRALLAVQEGFETWRRMTAWQRQPIIHRIGTLIEERK